MKLIPVEKSVGKEVVIGGLYVGIKPNQGWKDLIKKTTLAEEELYYKKLHDFIISTGLRESGRNLEGFVVLFDDDKIGYFTKKRWADIMCAAWNDVDEIKRSSEEWLDSKPSSDLDF